MPTELDRRFDETLEAVTASGGRLVIGRDAQDRAIVENLPPTLPGLFRTFSALNADAEAVVAGEERLTFGDLDRISERAAQGLVARGIVKGDRVGIAMRNCPSWIVSYMGVIKAGGVATLLNGWWEELEMEHAIHLAEPKLIIADAPRAKRIAAKCADTDIFSVPVELPVEQALAELLDSPDLALPDIAPEDDATLLFTSGSRGNRRARCRRTARSRQPPTPMRPA